MASQFIIRPAACDDEGELGDLDRRNWSPLHAVTPEPEPPHEPFFDAAHRPEDLLVAVSDGGSVVGYVRVVPPTPLASNAHVRQIQGLVVDEKARGNGVARALVDAACDHARAEGASRITLRVLGHNVPARGLYTAAGFTTEGTLPGEFLLEGEYADDVLMGRSLAR